MLLLTPVYPVFLILKEDILVQASLTYEISAHQLEEARYHVSQFIQGEVGLETHLQIIISLVLLLLANSATRTITGLEVLFEEEMLFYLPTTFALALSIMWSLYSCVSSHMKGISKRREYSTTKSFLIMLIFTMASVSVRVFSCILFLTPALGLMNCLRHLQGEMYPYFNPYYKHGRSNMNDTFHFGNAPTILWGQITRWSYVDEKVANPPSQTLYTLLSIEWYFCLLICSFALNVLLQLIIKRFANEKVFNNMSWIDCLIHGISCCMIPYPMEDWDEKFGTVASYKTRKNMVLKEMLASIMLNFVFNLLFLSPLIVLGVNVFERHNLLLNSIGAFPEEYEAFDKIILLLSLGYSLLVLCTTIQVVSYYYFNGKYHPFALIVMPEQKCMGVFVFLYFTLHSNSIYFPVKIYKEVEMASLHKASSHKSLTTLF